MYNRRLLVPVLVAVEKDVVNGVTVAAVGARDVIPGIPPKTGGVIGVKSVSCNELEGCGLVGAGLGGEDPFDEWV